MRTSVVFVLMMLLCAAVGASQGYLISRVLRANNQRACACGDKCACPEGCCCKVK